MGEASILNSHTRPGKRFLGAFRGGLDDLDPI